LQRELQDGTSQHDRDCKTVSGETRETMLKQQWIQFVHGKTNGPL